MNSKHATIYQSEREALGKPASQFRRNNLAAKPVPGEIICLDMFAGSGGFSLGLHRAARTAGFRVRSTLINHWPVALDNAAFNLGDVTVINAGVQEVDPWEAIPGGYVDILLCAPECIFFSSARGAKPINDQRRSTAAEVLRFLEELYVESLLLENVVELSSWGPINETTMRPIPERKGEFFKAFLKAIARLGYNVDYRDIVAANHGDPTTRKRLFLCAQRSRRVTFPVQTHSKGGVVPGTLPWVPARDIIDFNIKGSSIFSRAQPHVAKTVRRLRVGLLDQVSKTPLAAAYVESVDRFAPVVEAYYNQINALPAKKKLGRNLTKEERTQVRRVKAAAQQQHQLLVEQVFRDPVGVFEWDDILLHDALQPTLDDDKRFTLGTMNAVSPLVTKLFGTGTTSDVNDPLDTIKAGGTTFGVAEPLPESFMVTVNHGASSDTAARHGSINDPVPTITTKGSHGVVQPFCLRANASDTSQWDYAVTSLGDPLRTITTKNNLSVIVPDATILPQHTYERDTIADPDAPLPTITTISRHGLSQPELIEVEPSASSIALNPGDGCAGDSVNDPSHPAVAGLSGMQPFLASYYGPKGDRDRRPRTVDEPLATQPTENRFAVVEPLVVSHGSLKDGQGEVNRTRQLDEPMPTTTTRGGGYLADPSVRPVDPVVIPQQRGRGVDADQLERPLRTVTAKNGTGVAFPLPEGFVTPNFGERDDQKPRTHALDAPLPTATSHGAGMLVQPDVTNVEPGKPYIIVSGNVFQLDIAYRMIQPSELLRAMSFTKGSDVYRFTKKTTASQQVRMIGNAVAGATSEALAAEALAYRFKSGEVTIATAVAA